MPREIRIAIIGSRETEQETMGEMYRLLLKVSTVLLSRGVVVGYDSGACWKGPDQLQFSLAHGGYGRKLSFKCYLPDDRKLAMLKRVHANTNIEFIVPPDTPERRAIVTKLHRAPDKLNEISWLLHGRNCNIISGLNLDRHVDFVYYSAKTGADGLPTGGTYMGVAYAKSVGVRCIQHGEGRELAWLEELKTL